MISLGDKLILTGKTRHGKNRINEHGNTWIIQSPTHTSVEFSNTRGRWVNVRSIDNTFRIGEKTFTTDSRWINLDGDDNFIIEKIIQKK